MLPSAQRYFHHVSFVTIRPHNCFNPPQNTSQRTEASSSRRRNMMLGIQIPSFSLNPHHHFKARSSSLCPFPSQNRCKEGCQRFHRLVVRKWGWHRTSDITPLQSLPNIWEELDAYDGEGGSSNAEEGAPEFTPHGFNLGSSDPRLDKDSEQLMKEVELLLEPEERDILMKNKGPDFSKLSSPKWIPFHTLATSGQIFFMDDALNHGIDVNSVDKDGLTALHKAVLCKKEAVVSRLLRRGADPNVRDKDGATLLHYAVEVSAIQTIKLLIKLKVDVNLADNEGWTALHLAVQSRTRDVAKILLVNGADKTVRNKDGNTPFDLAICFGKGFKSYELTKLLRLVPQTRVV